LLSRSPTFSPVFAKCLSSWGLCQARGAADPQSTTSTATYPTVRFGSTLPRITSAELVWTPRRRFRHPQFPIRSFGNFRNATADRGEELARPANRCHPFLSPLLKKDAIRVNNGRDGMTQDLSTLRLPSSRTWHPVSRFNYHTPTHVGHRRSMHPLLATVVTESDDISCGRKRLFEDKYIVTVSIIPRYIYLHSSAGQKRLNAVKAQTKQEVPCVSYVVLRRIQLRRLGVIIQCLCSWQF
jgi:hypothetical protein